MTNQTKFRFAVGSDNGAQSNIWLIKAHRGQLYAATREMGRIVKFSFHSGGYCHYATTLEHQRSAQMELRHRVVWRRPETPPANTGECICLLALAFPTNALSRHQLFSKAVHWISPAPVGRSAVVELFATRDREDVFQTSAEECGRTTIAFAKYASDESFAITSRCDDFPGWKLRVPASLSETRDLVVNSGDPTNTGLPVRLAMISHPKDGEYPMVLEQGAYWVSNAVKL